MDMSMFVSIKNVLNRPQMTVVLDITHLTRASVEFVKFLCSYFRSAVEI